MTEKINKRNVIVLGNHNLETYKDHSLVDYVLRVIWREHRISRAEIARKLGLSRSTVTEIVKDLLKTEFVVEVGIGKSSGGRRPVVLEFQDDSKCIFGVDIGATHVSVTLTNLRGKLLTWKEKKHPVRDDPEGTWKLVIELCESCLSDVKSDPQHLLSIGVAFPSPVDRDHPEYLSEEIIPGWKGKSGLEKLRKHYDKPVYLDNDANLGALAEHWWGSGKGIDDLIYIKIANGIGAGYILGGEIYRGARGIAGEMSHMSIDLNGQPCGCGLRGCLATYVAAWALEERAHNQISIYPGSLLNKADITITKIEDAALEGDELALKVVKDAAEYLSLAIASLVNLTNPKMVIIGGSLSRLGDLLLEPINEKIENCNLVNSITPTKVCLSQLDTKAIAVGAATLALEETFAEPNLLSKRQHAGSL